MRIVRSIYVASLALGLTTSPNAQAGLVLTGTPKVRFHADGPAGFNIDGQTKTMTVADDGTTLRLVVPLSTVDSGISLRDHHMLDYAGVKSFPDLVLEVPRSEVKLPAEKGDVSKVTTTATFTCHGQSQPVQVKWTIKKGKANYLVKGSFTFNTESHGIEIPSYMGITVDPAMSANAKFNLIDEASP